MQLTEWLIENGVSVTSLSLILKVHRTAIYHWLRGSFQPRKQILDKIIKITKGRVKYAHQFVEKDKIKIAGVKKCPMP